MTYLSPEIEAWSRNQNAKSLVSPVISCGIFQDCDNEVPKINHQHNQKKEGL